ncbi:LPS-assembly protein LptD [Phaeovulum sp.]|uniref:LPS-assembly protein LptD n=1 Tax=Phaeovulum sp. TaxID=2934796 RepID=UPI003563C15F
MAAGGAARICKVTIALALGFALVVAPATLPSRARAETIATTLGAATLLADRIHLANASVLIAEGSVEVFYNGARLLASRVAFDSASGELLIEGPLWLTTSEDAGMVLLADSAELSSDMREGILRGARMVLEGELQLAANTIQRSEGRYTTLEEVVASSCQICVINPTPLWEIRARSVTHDSVEREITFEGAQFRVMGVPLAYIPRLTTPDPGVERKTGLLRPQLRTTSELGTGIKLPYFWTIGDSRDLTLTPYLSTSRTATLGARYRQAFDFGSLEIEGAVTRDDILPDETRGYIFADASFDLPEDFQLELTLRAVTDSAYTLDYDITDDDRLWSGATLLRVRPDQMIWARIGSTESLREGESNSTQPMQAGDLSWTQVLRPSLIGGELVLETELGGYRRSSHLTVDGVDDDDLVSDGRDALRASFDANWQRTWVLPGGVETTGLLGAGVDFFMVAEDDAYASQITRWAPTAAVEVRWPWVRSRGSVTEVIQPVAQLVWTGNDGQSAPNEDSVLVEFDEGNLFALSRYSGKDARETGLRANLGISWTRDDTNGWSTSVLAGRVLRWDDLDQFGTDSALSGSRSDWLLSTSVTTPGGIEVYNRALFDDSFDFNHDELLLAVTRDQMSFTAGYLWMEASPDEGLDDPTRQLLLDASWSWNSNWTGSLGTRYDFVADRAASADIGLSYANECVKVDLSLSRSFASSTSVTPQTDFGLDVELVGFGSSSGGQRRSCMR